MNLFGVVLVLGLDSDVERLIVLLGNVVAHHRGIIGVLLNRDFWPYFLDLAAVF